MGFINRFTCIGNIGLVRISLILFQRFLFLFISMTFLLPLVSCTPQPSSSLRIGSDQWPGYGPLYLARDLGYLDNTAISLYELPNASVMLNAFRNRAIDMATITLDEALMLQHDGMDVRILLVLDNSYGADVLMAKPGIHSLKELKGKRIGLESGALGAFMLSRSLEISGLTPADVIPVPVTIDKQVDAYRNNQFDALVTFDPVRTELLNAGAHILLDSTKMPNEIFDVLVVHADIYQQRPEDMKQVINIWFHTLDYIKANPKEAAERMAPRINLTPGEFQAAMAGVRQSDLGENWQLLTGEYPAILNPAKNLAKIMLQNRLINSAVNPALLIDKKHKDLLQ